MSVIGVRAGALCAVAAVGLAVSACGDNTESAGTSTTITIEATSYVTRVPVTTTTAAPTTDASPGEQAATEQLYTVQSGDFFSRIAERYGISVEELVNYNQFPDGAEHVLVPGDTIKIPPGADVPGEDGVTTDPPTEPTDRPTVPTDSTTQPTQPPTQPTTGPTQPPSEDTGPPAPTTDAPGNCAPGSYTVQEGDTTRIGVAEKFDVSVEAMDAANAGTEGYESFYVGLEIVIPAGSDC